MTAPNSILTLDLLNNAIDAEGVGITLPQDAIGIMGQQGEASAQVIRGGQIINVKPGEYLLKGDVIKTGMGKGQEIYLSASNPGALTKVMLVAEQDVTLDTNSALQLSGDVVEVPVNDALLAATEGSETAGLFGAAGLLGISGGTAAAAAGGVALAAAASGGGGDAATEDMTGSNTGTPAPDANTGDGNAPGTDAGAAPEGGMFASGGATLDALPVINMNPTDVTFESLGTMFDANSPASSDSGLPVASPVLDLVSAGQMASPLSALAAPTALTDALAPVLALI
jgi:hypothetical protein